MRNQSPRSRTERLSRLPYKDCFEQSFGQLGGTPTEQTEHAWQLLSPCLGDGTVVLVAYRRRYRQRHHEVGAMDTGVCLMTAGGVGEAVGGRRRDTQLSVMAAWCA